MNSLHADVARATIDARHAEASRRRAATEARGLRRLRRRVAVGTDPAPATTPWPEPIPITRHQRPGAAAVLEALLALVAVRVAEHGTAVEARVLDLVAASVRWASPGVAAALVDWNGSEVARQRAFGVAHGVVLGELDSDARSALLDQILGTDLSLAG